VPRALLAGLDDAGWEIDTPATGWAIRDQVSRLGHFDDAAVRYATEPGGPRRWLRGATAVPVRVGLASPDRELRTWGPRSPRTA
jgi:hypothetical protein